jgi:aldehyde:ferredoxin oxidoreductase
MHGRALGRCGVGAVMGSKKLKAIVANGTKKVPVANPDAIREINKSMSLIIKRDMQGMKDAGTGGGLEASEELGNLPVRNWGQGSWKDGAVKTTGMTMTRDRLTSTYSCGTCMISCGRVVTAEGGPYDGREMAGPEYETLGLMGTNLMNDNLDTVIKANELCNRYGLDTISAAGVLGFTMEAAELGLLKEADFAGVPLEWGSPKTIEGLLEAIAFRTGPGDLLARGVRELAEVLGPPAREIAAHVKGLEPPAHDGRAKFTAAIGMATSARGACHLSGFAHDFEEGAVLEDLGSPALTDRFTPVGKAENVFRMQNLMGLIDSAVTCKFPLFGGLTVNPLIAAINAATGWDLDRDEFFRMGERIFNIKRLYNNRLGITRMDDTLPPRMLRLRRGGGTDHLPPLNEMLEEYYRYRGWDEFGRPGRAKTAELGLEKYAALAGV